MIAYDFADVRRILVWHEAAGDFCARQRGHDGFAACTLIAAGQAVDLKGRPRAALFGGSEAAFAKKFFYAESFFAVRTSVTGRRANCFARRRTAA